MYVRHVKSSSLTLRQGWTGWSHLETLVEHEVATFGIKVVTGNFLLQECTGSVGHHGASIESHCPVLAFPLADVFPGQAGHVS